MMTPSSPQRGEVPSIARRWGGLCGTRSSRFARPSSGPSDHFLSAGEKREQEALATSPRVLDEIPQIAESVAEDGDGAVGLMARLFDEIDAA